MAFQKRQQLYKNAAECEKAILSFTKSPEACRSLFEIGAYDHGREYHQGLTNDRLTKRAQDDKAKDALSTFYRPMENLLCASLKTNYKQLAEWFVHPPGKDDPKYKEDEYDENTFKITTCFSHPVGRGIDTATRSEYDCRVAAFIVKRDDVLNTGSIGIRIKTAFPDIKKALAYERDAKNAGTIDRVGHYCYDHNFLVHDVTEMASAKTQDARFAIIASVMNNWQPGYDLLDSSNRDRLSYYDPRNDAVVLKTSGPEAASIVLYHDFRVESTVKVNGRFVNTKPTTITAKYPELAPYMDKLIELVHMAKDKSVSVDEPATISEAEYTGEIKYLENTHEVNDLLDLKTQTKVEVTFPDALEVADGYILQADNYRNKQKDNETIFVYQENGERRTLDPKAFGVEYRIREYDSIPGPNAKDYRTSDEQDATKDKTISRDRDSHSELFNDR